MNIDFKSITVLFGAIILSVIAVYIASWCGWGIGTGVYDLLNTFGVDILTLETFQDSFACGVGIIQLFCCVTCICLFIEKMQI